MDQKKRDIKITILRYARYVEVTLKKYKNIKLRLQDKILERIEC